jgi:hypothetical protein
MSTVAMLSLPSWAAAMVTSEAAKALVRKRRMSVMDWWGRVPKADIEADAAWKTPVRQRPS